MAAAAAEREAVGNNDVVVVVGRFDAEGNLEDNNDSQKRQRRDFRFLCAFAQSLI